MAPATHKVTATGPSVTVDWSLSGLTQTSFSEAKVGWEGAVWDAPFGAFGLRWRLVLFPDGFNEAEKGNVTPALMLLTKDAEIDVRFTFTAADVSKPATACFSTRVPQPAHAGNF